MVCVFLLAEAYSEIVDYEREHDIACDVTEQAWGVGALDVAVGAEVPDETVWLSLPAWGSPYIHFWISKYTCLLYSKGVRLYLSMISVGILSRCIRRYSYRDDGRGVPR